MRNRIELKRALDALQEIAGDASDLIPALEAAEKVFDWVLRGSRLATSPEEAARWEAALSEAFAEACDREAEWTGRA